MEAIMMLAMFYVFLGLCSGTVYPCVLGIALIAVTGAVAKELK